MEGYEASATVGVASPESSGEDAVMAWVAVLLLVAAALGLPALRKAIQLARLGPTFRVSEAANDE